MKTKKTLVAILSGLALLGAGCGPEDNNEDARQKVDNAAKKLQPYLPQNQVEFNNYNKAQELYDSPETIIWCSTTWGNPSSPIVTIPIAGKLTSSSTTFFRPETGIEIPGSDNGGVGSARSVDGLFHPNPPQYRYGFTPGGQYVDFFNMDTVCTTALTKFQREQTEVSISTDAVAAQADAKASQALKNGNKAEAQRILEGIEE